jgi:hypothetical protein
MANVKFKMNCKACLLSKRDPKARARIRQAFFRREEGDETLADIAKEFGISIPSMYNHAKKHLKDTEPIGQQRKAIAVVRKKAEFEGKVQKELELQLDAETVADINVRPAEIIALDEWIAQGAAMVKEGTMKMTPQAFLGAITVKTKWASTQQNNKIELLRTMNAFRSGAVKKVTSNIKEGEVVNELTAESGEGVDRGADEAINIYRATFGNAVAPRTEEIHNRSDTTKQED